MSDSDIEFRRHRLELTKPHIYYNPHYRVWRINGAFSLTSVVGPTLDRYVALNDLALSFCVYLNSKHI